MPFILDAFRSNESNVDQSKRTDSNDALQFQMMLPGVNLPFDEIVYYTLA